jgi:hypothetical protein
LIKIKTKSEILKWIDTFFQQTSYKLFFNVLFDHFKLLINVNENLILVWFDCIIVVLLINIDENKKLII